MVEEAAKRRAAAKATLKVLSNQDKKSTREREREREKSEPKGSGASASRKVAAAGQQQPQQQPSQRQEDAAQQPQQQPSQRQEDAGDDRFAEEPEAPGEEQQRAVVPKSPDQPTADQIAQHEASGHAVHRSWCVHCQGARKMINPHYKIRRAELETSLPTLHMDYFFLGRDKQEDDVMSHLVVRCDKTNRTWATSLPEKGTHPYNVTWLAGIIREAGWKKMCLFSDNENAMKALKLKASEEVKGVEFDLRECPTSTERENAPSNGVAEAAV